MKKNVSAARSEAARRNGARSRGPKTPEGKAVARLNAVTHGLTAKTLLLEGENEERFKLLLYGLHLDHAPQSTTEGVLVEQMAIAAWRLRRSAGFEKKLLDLAAEKIDHTDPETRAALGWAQCPEVRLLARYEAGHQRYFRQSLRELRSLHRGTPPHDEGSVEPNEPSAPASQDGLQPEQPAEATTENNEAPAPAPGTPQRNEPNAGPDPYPRAA